MSRVLDRFRRRFNRLVHHALWWISRLMQALDRSYHQDAVKVQTLLRDNSEEAFNRVYSDPDLLEHYLVGERLSFYREVARRIDHHFHSDKALASCLDAGCGTGHLLVEMRKVGFSGRLVGLDSASAAGQHVRSHGFEFCHGDLSDQHWRSEFDIVLCTEVLEHCAYPAALVRLLLEVVKPGGMIAITVPDGRKDTWEGHIHFWSPESFKLFIDSFEKSSAFEYFDNTNFCIMRC